MKISIASGWLVSVDFGLFPCWPRRFKFSCQNWNKFSVTQYKIWNEVMLWLTQMIGYNAYIPLLIRHINDVEKNLCLTIGHFRISLSLFLGASLGAHLFMWKWDFIHLQIKLSLCTRPRFDGEAWVNSEMGYFRCPRFDRHFLQIAACMKWTSNPSKRTALNVNIIII